MLVASRDDGFEKLPMNSAVPFPKSLPFGIGKASKNGRMAGTAAWRAANVGTGVVVVLGSRSRNPSYEKKKKVFGAARGAKTGQAPGCRLSLRNCGNNPDVGTDPVNSEVIGV